MSQRLCTAHRAQAATAYQVPALRQEYERQEKLKVLLNRVLLRRTKEGTIKDQLPRKTDNIVFCPLAPMQKRAYRRGARLDSHAVGASRALLSALLLQTMIALPTKVLNPGPMWWSMLYLSSTACWNGDPLAERASGLNGELHPLGRRRLLESPDMQLFVRGPEPCDCGSGKERMRCCYSTAPAEQGGIVWPHYHDCPCEYLFHPLLRPDVRCPASPALLRGIALEE